MTTTDEAKKAHNAAYHRKYRATHPDYYKKHAQHVRDWRARHVEKKFAHDTVNNAVKLGKMVRPTECSNCDYQGTVHGHHNDYSKPLVVVWLCEPCHKSIHKEKS